MTTRELRQMLTAVDDQEMTIRQLRMILSDLEDQDQVVETATMRMLGLNSYLVEFEGVKTKKSFPTSTTASEFFTAAAKAICFSDCTDEEVTDIRFHGKLYRYQGWKPGMLYVFEAEDGERWEGRFPEWDH